MSESSISLAQTLKNAKERYNHTYKELANMFDTSYSTVYNFCNGNSNFLSLQKLRQIKEYCNTGRVSKEFILKKVTPEHLVKMSTSSEVPAKIKYIRDTNRNPIGVFVAKHTTLEDREYITMGMSLCNPSDKFFKNTGKALALHRANQHWKEYTYSNKYFPAGEDLTDVADRFIASCIRYFADRMVICPRWVFKK